MKHERRINQSFWWISTKISPSNQSNNNKTVNNAYIFLFFSPTFENKNLCIRIQVKRLIKENAVYEKRPSYKRCCWYVNAEMLSRYGQEALPVPCQWTYLTAGAREEPTDEPQAATGSQGNSPTTPQTSSTTSASKKRKSTGSMSITKFMKRCTDHEKVQKRPARLYFVLLCVYMFKHLRKICLKNMIHACIYSDVSQSMYVSQRGTIEPDGFQADTEDDDEEDCVITSTQPGEWRTPPALYSSAQALMLSVCLSVCTPDALFSSLLVKPVVLCCSSSQRWLHQGKRLCHGGHPLRSLCTPRGQCLSHPHQCVRTYQRLLQIPPKIFPGSELHGFSKEESVQSSIKMMRHTRSRRLLLCTMFVQSDPI